MRISYSNTAKRGLAGVASTGLLAAVLMLLARPWFLPHGSSGARYGHVVGGILIAGALGTIGLLARRWGLRNVQRAGKLELTLHALERRFAERTSELQSANDQLEAAIEEAARQTHRAELASEAKSAFLANMSHEIRTPMTAILGFTECLRDESLSRETRMEAVHTIRRNGEYLLQLINDLLDLSKIEAGKLVLECLPCCPIKLVEEVNSLMDIRAEAKGLSFDLDFIGLIPETIHTDPTRLRQILINLVGNAIKFTSKGGLTLVTRLVKEESSEPLAEFRVIDTGPGLSAEQLAGLFRPFAQGNPSTTRTHGGTGLGLTISRRLARQLGGDITVDSRLGEGSTFCLTVRIGCLHGIKMIDAGLATRTEEEPPPTPTKIPPLAGRILVVEDCPDNQRLMRFILGNAGAEVTLADNGRIGVQFAQRAQLEEKPFDVILMDMQMPVMDGYAATRALRAWDYAGPIIATTAHAMKDQLAQCLEAGCDGHITKPIDRTALIKLVAQYMPAHAATFALPSAATR